MTFWFSIKPWVSDVAESTTRSKQRAEEPNGCEGNHADASLLHSGKQFSQQAEPVFHVGAKLQRHLASNWCCWVYGGTKARIPDLCGHCLRLDLVGPHLSPEVTESGKTVTKARGCDCPGSSPHTLAALPLFLAADGRRDAFVVVFACGASTLADDACGFDHTHVIWLMPPGLSKVSVAAVWHGTRWGHCHLQP